MKSSYSQTRLTNENVWSARLFVSEENSSQKKENKLCCSPTNIKSDKYCLIRED